MWMCVCVCFSTAFVVSTVESSSNSRRVTAISDTYDESARTHALAPKCRTEIDGGTMRRSVWSGKKTLRLAAVRTEDYRGVGIEREWEREREREEKKSRVKRGRPTAINQNPVTYCCVLHHYYIRVQYIYYLRDTHVHTRTASCHVYISTIHVCVCACQNPLT
jgi:hypothetical protein